ncbi:MAG: peptide ABC transporter substrate-binding protein [Firmicutes bacterium]|nr:peptide ABC transporter substrate-binding protein [Bacillota bacterium]
MGKGMRFWASFVVVFCLTATLVCLLFKAVGREGKVFVQIARNPASLDPALMSRSEERLVGAALYEGLAQYNAAQRRYEGVLAEKWEVAQKGRIYTFFLRKGLRFHNGLPVTAGDVKFSWERLLESDNCTGYGYLLQNVIGAEEKLRGITRGVKGLEVLDTYTLRVFLKEPDWTFPAVVSSPALAVVSQKAVQKSGPAYGSPGSQVVGTGPFYLASWGPGRIELRRNRRYFGKKPKAAALQFLVMEKPHDVKRYFEAGRLDVLAGVPPQLALALEAEKVQKSKPGFAIVKKPVLALYFLGFNSEQDPFGKNRDLRLAIDRALDKNGITRELLGAGGRALKGFLPPELLFSERDASREGVAGKVEALRLLARAGFPCGSRLPPLVFAYNESPGHEFLARFLQEQLGQVGIDLQIRKIPWQKFQNDLRKGIYPFFRLGWEADYPEAGNILYYNFASTEIGRNNYTRYRNETLDALLREARGEQDPERRAGLYRKAEEIILAEAPVVPLFQRVAVFVYRRELQGFSVDPLGRIDFSRLWKTDSRLYTFRRKD